MRPTVIPDEVLLNFAEIEAKKAAFQSAHGEGNPIMMADLGDWRFVAVGNALHYSPKEKTSTLQIF